MSYNYEATAPFTFQFRRGNAAEWTSDDPILHAGEPGFESDTGKLKLGDGVHTWTELDYFPNVDDIVSGVASVDGQTGIVTLSASYAAKSTETSLSSHTANTSNPHSVTKSQVGLANVDNTSDVNKPVSTATQTALDLKAAASDLTAHTSNTSNPHSVTKTQVGLANVDNTSDANKPVSTATQTALNGKSDTTHNHVVGPVATLTDNATIALNAALGTYFKVTLGGNRTMGTPTNPTDGQRIVIEVTQDGTGSRTLDLGTAFVFGSSFTSITLSTAAGKIDLIGAIYSATKGKWLVTAFAAGF